MQAKSYRFTSLSSDPLSDVALRFNACNRSLRLRASCSMEPSFSEFAPSAMVFEFNFKFILSDTKQQSSSAMNNQRLYAKNLLFLVIEPNPISKQNDK